MNFNLLKYREAKGLSQTELARMIGVSQITISNWELQKTYPTAEQVYNIAVALDCSADDLLGIEVTPQMIETQKLVEEFLHCSDERKADLIRQAKDLAKLSRIEEV